MGLDNGIRLDRNKKPYRKDLFPVGEQCWNNDIEFAYWRKCWGIRAAILGCLGGEVEGKYSYNINLFELRCIIDTLELFLDKAYWEKNAESIFNYECYLQQQTLNITNLKWLYKYKLKHPKAPIYFYDSY